MHMQNYNTFYPPHPQFDCHGRQNWWGATDEEVLADVDAVKKLERARHDLHVSVAKTLRYIVKKRHVIIPKDDLSEVDSFK